MKDNSPVINRILRITDNFSDLENMNSPVNFDELWMSVEVQRKPIEKKSNFIVSKNKLCVEDSKNGKLIVQISPEEIQKAKESLCKMAQLADRKDILNLLKKR